MWPALCGLPTLQNKSRHQVTRVFVLWNWRRGTRRGVLRATLPSCQPPSSKGMRRALRRAPFFYSDRVGLVTPRNTCAVAQQEARGVIVFHFNSRLLASYFRLLLVFACCWRLIVRLRGVHVRALFATMFAPNRRGAIAAASTRPISTALLVPVGASRVSLVRGRSGMIRLRVPV
jgi:hypothetical protein